MATSISLVDQLFKEPSLVDQVAGDTGGDEESPAPAPRKEFNLPATPYDDIMRSASEEHGVPYEILYSNLRQESQFNPKAISKTGARGVAQFMPGTAKDMGVADPHDPVQAIPGSAKYLKQLYNEFGDWRLAVAAYNSGPKPVRKAGNKIPDIAETQEHVRRVFRDGIGDDLSTTTATTTAATQKTSGDISLVDQLFKDEELKSFDPEGSDYDYETAKQFGLKPDKTGHWPSREPSTGMLLKGRSHETWPLTEKGETEAGYKIVERNGRYYSIKNDENPREFYTRISASPYGIVHPAVSAQMGRKGFGPKPEGGWDELGRPLDANGVPYNNEGIDKDKLGNPIAETLKGLSSLAAHPMEVIRGGLDFVLSAPGFGVGLLGAAGRGGKTLVDQLAYGKLDLDKVYTSMSQGMEESMKFFEPGKSLVVGEPTKESQLVGQVVMAPMNVISQTFQETAKLDTFNETPNIRGALKITGDVVALMSMGYLLHGGSRRAEFAKEVEDISKEAKVLADKEIQVNQSLDTIVKNVQLKELQVQKQMLEAKAAQFAKKFGDDIAIIEEAGLLDERIAQEKMRPVVESQQMIKLEKELQKEATKTKIEDKVEELKKDTGPEIGKVVVDEKTGKKTFKVNEPVERRSRDYVPASSVRTVENFPPSKGTDEIVRYYKAEDKLHMDGEGNYKLDTHAEASEIAKEKGGTVVPVSDGKFVVALEPQGRVKFVRDMINEENIKLAEKAKAGGLKVIEPEPEPKAGPKRKKIETKPTGKRTLGVKEAKAELDPVYDLIGDNKYKNKRKVNIEEHNLQPGEPAEIHPTWHDGVYRHTILKTADGKLSLGRSGSYDSIMMPGQVAGAKSGPLQPGTTLYIVDSGPYPNQISKVSIYRTAPVTKELPKPTGEQKVLPEPVKEPKPAQVTEVKTVEPKLDKKFNELEAEEELSPAAKAALDRMIELTEAEDKVVEPAKPVKPSEKIDYLDERKTSDIDTQTGTETPEITGDNGIFWKDKEKTLALDQIYKERRAAVESDPEVYVQKLINDVRMFQHGEKGINIDAVRDKISEMAARSGELRDFFMTGADHLQFVELTREAAKWARGVGRSGGKDISTRLNAMVPLDKLPGAIREVLGSVKSLGPAHLVKAIDVFRNKELFNKTGFWLGKDGKWRYELDDSKATIEFADLVKQSAIGESVPLESVYKHPTLYDHVPEMYKTRIVIDNNVKPGEAYYNIDLDTIKINGINKRVIAHEVQHAINIKADSRFKGTNVRRQRDLLIAERLERIVKMLPRQRDKDILNNSIKDVRERYKAFPEPSKIYQLLKDNGIKGLTEEVKDLLDFPIESYEAYRRDPGEMESRLVEHRMNMTPKERRSEAPWETLDKMLKNEGVPSSISYRLYSGLPLDKMAKLVKEGWKELQEKDIKFKRDIRDWLMGNRTDMPRPSQVYRGVPKGSDVAKKDTEYVHGTPWGYSASRGGKGAFGDPSSHDVYSIPATKDTKYYRGGSLEGDPLERTRIKNAKGMTWDELMNEAKTLYQNEVLREKVRDRKLGEVLGEEVQRADHEYIADSVVNDLARASFETDMRGKDGIWRGQSVPYELDREMPKLRSYETLESIVTAKRRAGYADDQIPELKILNRSGRDTSTLYSGDPAIEAAAKAIIAGAKKVGEYTAKARGMKELKFGEATKMLRQELNRAFVDRSGNIRKELLDKLGNTGYEVLQKLVLSKGASARSAAMLKQMRSEVYDGLSKHEKKVLDDIILDDRMIDIAKYKSPTEYNYPGGMKPADFIAHRELFPQLEKISPERAQLLDARAKAYFEWMRKPLKDMLESGLIDQAEHDLLASHNYRKTKLVEIFDKKRPSVGTKGKSVYDSGIEALSRGRETDIYEPSSEIMALEVFNRSYGRILNNEANKTLIDLAKKDPTNGFARVKEKDNPIPTGWHRVFAYEGGERKSVYISPDMAKEWINSSPEMSYRLSQFVRWASGSVITRTFATGIEWGFALANLPRDMMHLWFAARTFENGKWSPVYNPNLPVYGLQIGRDLATVFADAALKKGRYNDYINEGGGMEFLVHQGRLFQRGRHLESGMDKVYNVLGYLGETSEVLTRLAIRERVIRNKANEQGISMEQARNTKKITDEATFAARDYMDFGQGGGVSKALDNGMPYLNATIQGTRGLLRSLKPGSGSALSSSYKLAQFAALTTGVYIAARAGSPETMKALQGDVAMQNNLCIPLGDQFSFLDEQGQTRYMYLKIPLDPGQKFFKTFFEASADKWLGNEVDVDRVTGSLSQLSPVGMSSLPPTISGALGYATNKNFWLNEDIWKGSNKPFSYPNSKEEYTDRTPQAYKDFGQVTGVSPERTKYAVEQLVTQGSMWSYLLNQGYDKTFGDLTKERKEQHIAMTLSQVPTVKRFFGVTKPYAKYASKFDEAEEMSTLKKFTENRGMDTLVDSYLYGTNTTREQVTDYALSFEDPNTFKRLMERFRWEEAIQDLPEKAFWKRMKGLDTEAKAKMFVDRLKNSTPKEADQLWQEFAIIGANKGVITEDFILKMSEQMPE